MTNPTPRDSAQLPPLPRRPYPAHRSPDGTGVYFDAFTGPQMDAHYLQGYNDAREALRAQANGWREAIINALEVWNIYVPEIHDNSPRLALQALINVEVQTALDPAVSERARKLIDGAQAASVEPVALDFTRPLETSAGEPVKYICADVVEYKCARVCVDKETGIAYSGPYFGLRIRNAAPPAHIPADVEAQAGTVAARFASLLSELERRFPDPEPYSARAPEQRYLASIDAASSPQPQAVAASSPAQAVDAVSGQMLHEHYFLALYPHLDRFRGLDVWGELDQQEKAAWNRAALQASRQPQPQAQQGGGEVNVEAGAKTIAACMDYPWAHMPEQGRQSMREHARKVADALATKEQRS